MFIDEVALCISQNKKYNHEANDDKVRTWEWEWVNGTEEYSDQPQGDVVEVSQRMYKKYIDRCSR